MRQRGQPHQKVRPLAFVVAIIHDTYQDTLWPQVTLSVYKHVWRLDNNLEKEWGKIHEGEGGFGT